MMSTDEASTLCSCEQPNCSDSGDDIPQLSAHALSALQEFYLEQQTLLVKEEAGEGSEITEDWVSQLANYR